MTKNLSSTMATTTQQTLSVSKNNLKIKVLWHFNYYWLSFDDVTKISKHVFNTYRFEKMLFDTNLISTHLPHDHTRKYKIRYKRIIFSSIIEMTITYLSTS